MLVLVASALTWPVFLPGLALRKTTFKKNQWTPHHQRKRDKFRKPRQTPAHMRESNKLSARRHTGAFSAWPGGLARLASSAHSARSARLARLARWAPQHPQLQSSFRACLSLGHSYTARQPSMKRGWEKQMPQMPLRFAPWAWVSDFKDSSHRSLLRSTRHALKGTRCAKPSL